MNKERLTALLKPEHKEAGFYLEDEEDFVYLKRGDRQIAVWNSARVTLKSLLQQIDNTVALETVKG